MSKRGGQGNVATTGFSLNLDHKVRDISEEVYCIFKSEIETKYGAKLTKLRKMNQKQIPGGHGACCPDGGIICLDDKPVLAFEAKTQGPRGNAIERWYKNAYILTETNPECRLVTFASGPGCEVGKPIYEILYVAHRKHGYNIFNDETLYSCFIINDTDDDYTKIKAIMIDIYRKLFDLPDLTET